MSDQEHPLTPDPDSRAATPGGAPPVRDRTRRRARSGDRAVARGSRRNRPPALVIAAATLLLVGAVSWAISNGLGSGSSGPGPAMITAIPTEAGADGLFADGVDPATLTPGQCLRDFANDDATVTVVTCTTPHNAQLLASETFGPDASFPGPAALKKRVELVCGSVQVDPAAVDAPGSVSLVNVRPTANSWSKGDRRIDCFAVMAEGNTISRSLLKD